MCIFLKFYIAKVFNQFILIAHSTRRMYNESILTDTGVNTLQTYSFVLKDMRPLKMHTRLLRNIV